MANLSQIKREQMIEFLEKLKEQHNDDESLMALNQIEKELNEKKYGLLWEEHEEKADSVLKNHFVIFEEEKKKRIKNDSSEDPYNFLIEGDNLHSLMLLRKTHKGKIGIIYIDPPYNTGKQDFIYEDNYVDSNDGYQHSKWTSFMSKRLKIAHELLRRDGVIFISIDDNEQAALKLLCDEIFGAENYIGLVAVENNPKGRKNSKFLSVSNDFLLIYAKNISECYFIENIPKDVKDLAQDENGNFVHNSGKRVLVGENSFNSNVTDFDSNKHYSVYYHVKDKKFLVVKEKSISGDRPDLIMAGFDRYYSYNANGFVLNTYTDEKIKELFSLGALDFKNGKIYEKNFSTSIRAKSIWSNRKYTAVVNNEIKDYQIDFKTTSAKQELRDIFGTKDDVFSNPKNVGLIKMILTLIEDKNAIVLDFFAGSGTTAQAVLELNQEDQGKRSFILCTNNENQICEKVTYERIKTVITGLRNDGSHYSEGIKANLKYYKVCLIDKSKEDIVEKLMDKIAEMIQLDYGIDLEDSNYIVIHNDDEMDAFESNYSDNDRPNGLFISQDVLLSASQEKLIKGLNVFVVPDYYYESELREIGEVW